ncbi:MAG: glutamate racemase, glutamate racemase [Candidatus Peregrinibacteria bacterium GW2011_GWF2_38_29]|nr:MAG: glutamate racemase, glutamate racemase [Candidatus Peregrinibacteria bacterium GW2011_GWF2_38_29]HBB02636.1 hypothetical protein [Candidatus Peregrinibacteria bacterium]
MKTTNSSPLAVFDTGMGGLALVKEIHAKHPGRDVHFFTDNGRFPYGVNPRETAAKWLLQVAEFLKKRGVSEIILGCNTVTAMTEGLLPEDSDMSIKGPIIDTIQAVRDNLSDTALVIFATNTTINSGAYQRGLSDHQAGVAPLEGNGLETVIESEGASGAKTIVAIEESVDRMKKEVDRRGVQVDELAIVLGCTHFVLAEQAIRDVLRDHHLGWKTFNPLPYVVQRMLQEKEDGNEDNKGGLTVFHTAPFNDAWWNRCLEFIPQDMLARPEHVLLNSK